MIKRAILNTLILLPALLIIFASSQVDALQNINNYSYHIEQINFAALKYEVKEPTSLENPVTDPNFNKMRDKEINKSFAIPLVVGVLIIAIVAPIATWMYFSN